MSATDHLDVICSAINERRPLVLLLGQNAWSDVHHPDPLLISALKRCNRYSEEVLLSGFSSLLENCRLDEDFYDWLAEMFNCQPGPEWIEALAALPLNAIFTTSIDPSLLRLFRAQGRDVEAVLSKEDNPASPRHRRNLHITYLFGRAGEKQRNEAPPRSMQELRARTARHSTLLLSRIVETTTPLGILLIDGFSPGKDWLTIDILSGILSDFGPKQVYWFGWRHPEKKEDAQFIEELTSPGGPIVLVRERLATALRALELAHRIDLSSPQRFDTEGTVTIGSNLLELSPSMRLKTSTAASIIDDAWIAPLSSLGPDAEYAEFQSFHGHVEDVRRLFEGVRRGFSIRRSFERVLKSRVEKTLENIGRTNDPILIHGQSGSGKSLALARLALEVRSANKFPVLLALRSSRLPAVDELDEFCLKAEETGAPATLLICDANAPASRYRDLLRGFFSRGRKVVVVGSTYRIVDNLDENNTNYQNPDLLEAPAELSESELSDLTDLLERFAGTTFKVTGSEYLLPAIYRILPNVRPRLAAGLAQEARATEESLRKRGKVQSESVPKAVGILGQAMINAGLINPKSLLEERIYEFLGCMTDAAARAIDYVMLSGKLDCAVPVNLLMRLLGGGESLVDIASLFSGIDLFRWSANDENDIFVHPRLKIEAELISSRRLGTSQAEAEIAVQLIKVANPSSYENCERRFVLNLVHKLGPDGPFGKRYAGSYLEIARALTDMRSRRGVMDPSLMLQEATLRRRAFRDAPIVPAVDPASVLEEARETVELALDQFSGKSGSGIRRMCANLKVERAAIYGFRAVQRLLDGAPVEEVWQFYEAARDSWRSAIYTADTYFATDISVWVPNDLLERTTWSTSKHAELVADILDSFEQVDAAQLDPDQRELYEIRRAKVGQTLQDHDIKEDALKSLDAIGSKAGIFLRAREIGGSLSNPNEPKSEDIAKAAQVVSFMKKHQNEVREDARCLRYLLKALWCISTNTYLFGREKAPLPTKDRDIRDLLEVVELLGRIEGTLGDPKIQYLQAVLQWRLLSEKTARDIWYQLSQDTVYSDPRRVIRHHLWTDAGGKPRVFYGRVIAEDSGRGRLKVQVEEIRQEVDLLQRDFQNVDLRKGGAIPGGFNIAFNFIGPIAEPPNRSGGPQ